MWTNPGSLTLERLIFKFPDGIRKERFPDEKKRFPDENENGNGKKRFPDGK